MGPCRLEWLLEASLTDLPCHVHLPMRVQRPALEIEETCHDQQTETPACSTGLSTPPACTYTRGSDPVHADMMPGNISSFHGILGVAVLAGRVDTQVASGDLSVREGWLPGCGTQ